MLDRAVVLLVAQARPMLVADDTWRVFALLRDTADLVPGTLAGHARLAILDAQGRVFAASAPTQLETGRQIIGAVWHGRPLSAPSDIQNRQRVDHADGSVLLLEPVRSEDGQTLGFVFMEVDAVVFAPDWWSLTQTALIGMALAVMLLVPAGWWVGQQMTRPVARLVAVIERIGRDDPSALRDQVPKTDDPEMGRIGDAVNQLIAEMERRKRAEEWALSSERLAAVGRMTAAVAHELNNPLAGLLTATQTLRLHGGAEDTRTRTLNLLDRGLQQMRTTLAALLPQARREDRPLEPGDLDDIVTLVQGTANRQDVDIRVQLDVVSALRVPSAPLRQVMLNLLLNALKAAGEHGHIVAALRASASHVEFSVTNSGSVLSEAKFRSTLSAESGSDPRGFGLWVCSELASQQHGRFELDSRVTDGTRLVFEVPNKAFSESYT
ncbi:MAG: HAMP domain-containing sensor histidine kinase [Ideonella sp.]|nr:HAMP domain-containing sensor histidine kinase [Ideonella sp.]